MVLLSARYCAKGFKDEKKKKKKVSPAQELDGVGTQRLKTLGLAGGRAKG